MEIIVSIVKYLVHMGADINYKDYYDNRARIEAAIYGYQNMKKMFSSYYIHV